MTWYTRTGQVPVKKDWETVPRANDGKWTAGASGPKDKSKGKGKKHRSGLSNIFHKGKHIAQHVVDAVREFDETSQNKG